MKQLFLRGFFVTLLVLLVGLGVSQLTKMEILSAFDPVSKAFEEFELTDHVFSNLRDDPNPDPRIVIVNISTATRRDLSQAVRIISSSKPKVIGIDSFFNCEGGLYDSLNCPQLSDTLGNLMLASAIEDAGNVVLVSRLLQTDSLYNVQSNDSTFREEALDLYDSIEYSDPIFSDHATNAYANLPTGASYQEDVKICKSIIPQKVVNGERKLAFSVMMAMKYDSVKTNKFLARGNDEEVINFIGNIAMSHVKIAAHRKAMKDVSKYNALCVALDWSQFVQGQYEPSMFTNNVVILGYLGDYFGHPAWEDKFFTPLNTKVAGRANPDMFGPVIHANVVAMILNENYINEIPLWMQISIAIVACFFNVLLFSWIDRKFPLLYDGLGVFIQIFEILLVSVVVVYVFHLFSIKMDLTLTMAALALVGPCFDVYKGIENKYLIRLTPKPEEVLTPQNQEFL
jgi:CHASE2 domain-containing sensor protein